MEGKLKVSLDGLKASEMGEMHEPGMLSQGVTDCSNQTNIPYPMTHEWQCLGHHSIGKVEMSRAQFCWGYWPHFLAFRMLSTFCLWEQQNQTWAWPIPMKNSLFWVFSFVYLPYFKTSTHLPTFRKVKMYVSYFIIFAVSDGFEYHYRINHGTDVCNVWDVVFPILDFSTYKSFQLKKILWTSSNPVMLAHLLHNMGSHLHKTNI